MKAACNLELSEWVAIFWCVKVGSAKQLACRGTGRFTAVSGRHHMQDVGCTRRPRHRRPRLLGRKPAHRARAMGLALGRDCDYYRIVVGGVEVPPPRPALRASNTSCGRVLNSWSAATDCPCQIRLWTISARGEWEQRLGASGRGRTPEEQCETWSLPGANSCNLRCVVNKVACFPFADAPKLSAVPGLGVRLGMGFFKKILRPTGRKLPKGFGSSKLQGF